MYFNDLFPLSFKTMYTCVSISDSALTDLNKEVKQTMKVAYAEGTFKKSAYSIGKLFAILFLF